MHSLEIAIRFEPTAIPSASSPTPRILPAASPAVWPTGCLRGFPVFTGVFSSSLHPADRNRLLINVRPMHSKTAAPHRPVVFTFHADHGPRSRLADESTAECRLDGGG